jgi:hypothetical protein
MRPLVLIGIILIAVGGFLFYNGGTVTTRKKVLEIGDVQVTAPEDHTLPKWTAGAAVLAGIVIVVVGAQQRGRS